MEFEDTPLSISTSLSIQPKWGEQTRASGSMHTSVMHTTNIPLSSLGKFMYDLTAMYEELNKKYGIQGN